MTWSRAGNPGTTGIETGGRHDGRQHRISELGRRSYPVGGATIGARAHIGGGGRLFHRRRKPALSQRPGPAPGGQISLWPGSRPRP
jgi:hypothetical protein